MQIKVTLAEGMFMYALGITLGLLCGATTPKIAVWIVFGIAAVVTLVIGVYVNAYHAGTKSKGV